MSRCKPEDATVMFGDIVCGGFVDLPLTVRVRPYCLVPAWVPGYVVDLLQLNGVEPSTTVHLFVKGDCMQVSVILPALVDFVELTGTVST